ncbi:hypothetical protein [Cecembia lonarensis]|uniref:Uncharacterized protein n=1 Tax=Cecembia lonarensis (strain CCUG 58316 / KCTC 22772 / LW9) TaxID=1225176 RepID=K1LIA3_CECL9|nr:hypothetical protein [Cecembia lonarensis]EKB50008.1 hypothetical protein B879_01433 [Cecembia lonarensis LW9]
MVKVFRLVGIIIFSAILIFCYFLETSKKESNPEQYKVWNKGSILEERDFLCEPPFFEGKSAARISYKYRIYEKPEVRVAVIVDRFNSFIYKHHISDYLIRHEEYHIKLAHVFVKEINQSIKDKNLTFSEANQYLQDRSQRDWQYQLKYDKETNHSLIRAKQNYWEYKIDSMLNKSIVFPLFQETENIEVYFPDKPKNLVVSIDDEKFNGYLLDKYDVKFWIVDMEFNSNDNDTLTIENYLVNILFAMGQSDIIVDANLPYPKAIFESYSQDTVENEVVLDKLLLGKKSTYWLRNRYPIVKENEEVYKRMADQFFNSFKVIDE